MSQSLQFDSPDQQKLFDLFFAQRTRELWDASFNKTNANRSMFQPPVQQQQPPPPSPSSSSSSSSSSNSTDDFMRMVYDQWKVSQPQPQTITQPPPQPLSSPSSSTPTKDDKPSASSTTRKRAVDSARELREIFGEDYRFPHKLAARLGWQALKESETDLTDITFEQFEESITKRRRHANTGQDDAEQQTTLPEKPATSSTPPAQTNTNEKQTTPPSSSKPSLPLPSTKVDSKALLSKLTVQG